MFNMFSHLFATLSLICVLMLGVVGTATAHEGYIGDGRNEGTPCGWVGGGWKDCGGHNGFGNDPSAPELDPTLFGSGAAILAGGMILFNERRRKRK
jgi:hypothetical protein